MYVILAMTMFPQISVLSGLYAFMNWSTPRSEANEKVRKIIEANNGVRSPDDVRKRLDNYYLGPEERNSRFAKREKRKMLKYYEFLERYKEGGQHLDIAKEVGLSDSGARAYLEGATPRWVGLAGQIPVEAPCEGNKWLPMKYEHGGHGGRWSDWIEVPEKMTDYRQVMDVLKQIKPLENADMKRWDVKYGGDYSREERFMHLLGTYVSDSRVSSSSTVSDAFALNLSKSYEWSYDYGEASCYNLGSIGVFAHRTADKEAYTAIIETPYGLREIRGDAQFEWQSENTSLLKWIRKSCLGYDDSPKTYQKVAADWILNAPDNLRKSFLQGLSDGDGGVSTKGYYFSISTHSNHEFVTRLLQSFDVDTYESKTYVRTAGMEHVKDLSSIPPFQYASGKQKALEKAVEMIDSRRRFVTSNPLPISDIEYMTKLRKEGLSYNDIGVRIFDRYGYSLDPRDIWRILQKRT